MLNRHLVVHDISSGRFVLMGRGIARPGQTAHIREPVRRRLGSAPRFKAQTHRVRPTKLCNELRHCITWTLYFQGVHSHPLLARGTYDDRGCCWFRPWIGFISCTAPASSGGSDEALGRPALSVAGEAEVAGCRGTAFGGRTLLSGLLVASGRRDEVAFSRFYQMTSPWIFYLLRRRIGSKAQAEDATCRVYTTVWRRAPSFASSNVSALAWVTRIAYEVAGS